MNSFLPIGVVVSALSAAAFAAAPFEIQSGDRVLLMGDTLLEREGSEAALETLLTERFKNVEFTVRNLSFSADQPLGVSRASFGSPAEGLKKLREQLDLVKPTVAVLGYGMASSLEELTYRSGDPTLNPDKTRYGTAFSAEKFKADLGALMDMIVESAGGPVRFVLLGPLRHEDLRKARPGLPDPAAHNALLERYARAVEELAKERGARFVDQASVAQGAAGQPLTENGIHPSGEGLNRWAASLARELGWLPQGPVDPARERALREALQRRNELFFHRWRPANYTYILGFRKQEQGRNAVEIGQFAELLKTADATIAEIKAGKLAAIEAVKAPAEPASEPAARPKFELGEGVEISLWAENPLLSKPVQMNWDAKGRLWVASTPIYPQIEPGAYPTDRILVLEDTKRSGQADKSTVFAKDLLIPTGVEPDLTPEGRDAAYVGASTELLHLVDKDGDGKADDTRVVLSGFGTEDTHHTIHTLRWGVDGRLYFAQSIYIHSHIETPWGVVRLNSGGVFAYDPRTERLEVFCKGLINLWGIQTDDAGQMLLTDGAGGSGLHWAFPGAVFGPSEGAKKQMPGISPSGYPKFCGIEILRGPAFPPSWQGTAVTNNFRGQQMVRFSIADLMQGESPRSGYASADQPQVLRTPQVNFRPIDVKLGPDGALYVADWTNEVINHGEVDFRDPRRDKVSGRIWRITHREGRTVDWKSLWDAETGRLLDGLLSDNIWEQQQARRVLGKRLAKDGFAKLDAWRAQRGTPEAGLAAAYVRAAVGGAQAALGAGLSGDAVSRAWEARWRGSLGDAAGNMARLVELSRDASPRVRVDAVRALARIPGDASLEAVGAALETAPKNDPHYAFAVEQSVRELGAGWLEALAAGRWDWRGRENQLKARLLVMKDVDAEACGRALAGVMKDLALPADGSGPWAELVGSLGLSGEAGKLWESVRRSEDPGVLSRGLEALRVAAARGVRPSGDLSGLTAFARHSDESVAVPALVLSGAWKQASFVPELGKVFGGENPRLADAAGEGLRAYGGEPALKEIRRVVEGQYPFERQAAALRFMTATNAAAATESATRLILRSENAAQASAVWSAISEGNESVALGVVSAAGEALPPHARESGVRVARQLGGRGQKLEKALAVNSGAPVAAVKTPADWAKLTQAKGDAVRGEAIYHSMRMICVQCHQIGGAGGKLGPDMSNLGASAPLDYIIESVLDPAAKVKEGYHAVHYTLASGGGVTGIPFEETGEVFKVRAAGGLEIEVKKSDVKASEQVGSIMPAGLVEALSEAEKLDLFAFLGAVGKPGRFDASAGNVARAWRVFENARDAESGEKISTALPAYSLTDGRLLPEHWAMPVAALPPSEMLFAVAKFQLAEAGPVELHVVGAEKVTVDGSPAGNGPVQLSAGPHLLVVSVKRGSLPAAMGAQVSKGRFVTP